MRAWPVALILLTSGIIELKLNPILTNVLFFFREIKRKKLSDTSIFQIKNLLAERGFDPGTSGLSAQQASTAPLCLLLMVNQHILRVKLVQTFCGKTHPEGVFCVLAGLYTIKVVVAEWLRRWTRNPLGSPRAGSNPADYVNDLIFICSIKYFLHTLIICLIGLLKWVCSSLFTNLPINYANSYWFSASFSFLLRFGIFNRSDIGLRNLRVLGQLH